MATENRKPGVSQPDVAGPAPATLEADLIARAELQRQVAASCGCAEAAQVITDLLASRAEWIARFNKLPEIVERAEERGRFRQHYEAAMLGWREMIRERDKAEADLRTAQQERDAARQTLSTRSAILEERALQAEAALIALRADYETIAGTGPAAPPANAKAISRDEA